jgi:hypothetical protein
MGVGISPSSFFDVDSDGHVVLSVHVQPGAKRTGVVGAHGEAVKVRVTAPPEDGKANQAVAELLATTFGVRKGDVELLSGASSRQKRFRITGLAPDDVTARLGQLF